MKDNKITVRMAETVKYKPTKLKESKSNDGYVKYGSDNKYPEYIYEVYSDCATLQAIINGSADYTFGEGVLFKEVPETLMDINSEGDSLEDIILKCIYDLWIFGGFSLQVQYDVFHNITELIYLDFRYVRTSADGEVCYYNDKWTGLTTLDYVELPCFNPDKEKYKDETSQIYYFKGSRTRGVYPEPDYRAALVSAETQIEIQKFHYNSIINNFMVNGILNFNNASNVSDEVKEKVEASINDKFSGSENAAKLMISWNEDKDKAATFDRLSDDQFDKKYEALAESTRDNLFISMRAMPVIFGLTVQTGFNTQEFKDAFALYNKTAIRPKQQIMERAFNELLGNIEFKPFNIDFSDEEE